MKKVAVVGYGTEGKASCQYYLARGDEVTVCDLNEAVTLPDGVSQQLGDGYLNDLDRFDIIVRTAGMHPNIILAANPEVSGKMTTQLNEFLRVSPTHHIIGITGTKGKGTTSTLTAQMLEAAGKQVLLAGNIGEPAITHLAELTPESWVVLELSSFQLIDLQFSPHIAVCLMVVPEHLNWHSDMNEYMAAKGQLFVHQIAEDIAIYFADNENSKTIASSGNAQKLPYFAPPGAHVEDGNIMIDDQVVCATAELKLLGKHNWQNACAAVTAVWQAGVRDTEAIASVLTSFAGLEHRLEFVRELGGVRYYDDSFGTTPETAIVALQAFSEPKIVILGGSDKGASYEELARVVASSYVRKALLIGDQAAKIQAALERAGFSEFMPGGDSMNTIVATAHSLAENGDIVLLSTGCASFGMFENYKDRGNQFKQQVQALVAAA